MNTIPIKNWLNLFKKYWKAKNIGGALSLFSENVEYYETSEKRLHNMNEIRREWGAIKNQDQLEINFEPTEMTGDMHEVKWKISYVDKEKAQHNYHGIYKIRLRENGKCDYFMQIEE